MGKKESPYFKDVIPGSTMSLMVAPPTRRGRPRVRQVVRARGVLAPRFVRGGEYIVYWRPGTATPAENTKTWQLMGISIKGGRPGKPRRLLAYSDRVKIGRKRPVFNRRVPTLRTFADSDWILAASEGGYSALRLSTGEIRPLKVRKGWTLVQAVEGYQRHPRVVTYRGGEAPALAEWDVTTQKRGTPVAAGRCGPLRATHVDAP